MTTKRTVLVSKVHKAIDSTPSIRTAIAAALDVSYATVTRWSKNNDPYLCLPDSLKVIKQNISIPDGESYTEEVEIGNKYLAVN